MLKLTKGWYADGSIKVGEPVYILAAAIQMIEVMEVADGVVLTEVATGNRARYVVESPEEIMAMPEMVYAMFPPMMVSSPKIGSSA